LTANISKHDIEKAHKTIASYIHRTPVMQSETLNEQLGCTVFFKCENFQKAGSFKSRGATNALFSNIETARLHGVATHSSGNHAQALARVAKLAGVTAYIVMPENSNELKVNAVREYGGIVRFCPPTLQAREDTLTHVIEETGAIEIHPYDNPFVIAGQATAAKELIEDIPEPADILITPVGGGGLLSGTALSCCYFSPDTQVFAAEPEQANDAWKSFMSKTFIPSFKPDTIADGLKTSLGKNTFPIILKHVHNILTVSEWSIIESMKLVWLRMKIIIEPSSAVVIAAIRDYPEIFTGKKIGAIISGGNADIFNLPWNE
jgi:threonine dehydratase